MRTLVKFISMTLVLLVFSCSDSKKEEPAKSNMKFVTIGTGAVTGVYYPTGGALSRMLNKKADLYNMRASVESTRGSVYNVEAIVNGEMEFGIVQSDRQFQAYNGKAEWELKGARKKLRSIFSIYPESVALVATEESGIKHIKDLIGKRVNLGNTGSGQLQNSKDALSAFGISENDIQAEYHRAIEATGLLQDGKIDAYFYTVGHPNGNIKDATSGNIKVRLIDILGEGSELQNLLDRHPYYTEATILHEMYPEALNKKDITTFGVKATFVTSVDIPEDIVYAITKEVFDNLEEFKTLHPAYKVINVQSMFKGLSAPIHKGALKYYKEKGLDKYISPSLIIE